MSDSRAGTPDPWAAGQFPSVAREEPGLTAGGEQQARGASAASAAAPQRGHLRLCSVSYPQALGSHGSTGPVPKGWGLLP